jgi:hypothetical protein
MTLENLVKALWLLSFLLVLLAVALSAHAQTQAPTTNTVIIPDHPLHATQQDLAPAQNVLTGGVTVAHGERPLSDFRTEPKRELPLGDVARYYRTHPYIPQKEGQ